MASGAPLWSELPVQEMERIACLRLVGHGLKDCEFCSGSGQLVMLTFDENDGAVEKYESCAFCNGRGKVRELRCACCGQLVTVATLAALDLGMDTEFDIGAEDEDPMDV